MNSRPSEAEAVLLARKILRERSAKVDLGRTAAYQRIPTALIFVLGFIVLGAFGRELSSYFGATSALLGLLVLLTGAVLVLAVEVAILRRQVAALIELSQQISEA